MILAQAVAFLHSGFMCCYKTEVIASASPVDAADTSLECALAHGDMHFVYHSRLARGTGSVFKLDVCVTLRAIPSVTYHQDFLHFFFKLKKKHIIPRVLKFMCADICAVMEVALQALSSAGEI
jgi:hypothetical protein